MPPDLLTVATVGTPIGTMLVVVDAEGRLRALDWSDHEPRMRRLLRLHYGPGGIELRPGRLPASLRDPLERYYLGDHAAIDGIPVRTRGTAFQQAVWDALRAIPAGSTISYGELARRIGRPTAIRAAGHANGANPVGLVVPCHRVIGADSALTGYGGGLHRKRWLLEHEGAALLARQSAGT